MDAKKTSMPRPHKSPHTRAPSDESARAFGESEMGPGLRRHCPKIKFMTTIRNTTRDYRFVRACAGEIIKGEVGRFFVKFTRLRDEKCAAAA